MRIGASGRGAASLTPRRGLAEWLSRPIVAGTSAAGPRGTRSSQAVGHGSAHVHQVTADVVGRTNRASRSLHEGGSDLGADVFRRVQRLHERTLGQPNDADGDRLRRPDGGGYDVPCSADIRTVIDVVARHRLLLSALLPQTACR